jgi:hypothetical protein
MAAERDLAEWDREIEADFQRAIAATRAAGSAKRKKKEAEAFVMVPLWWIAQAAKLTHTPATLVLMELLYTAWRTKSSTFILPNARLQKWGMNRETKRRVLRNLAHGKDRMIVLEQRRGRAPRVTLIGL